MEQMKYEVGGDSPYCVAGCVFAGAPHACKVLAGYTQPGQSHAQNKAMVNFEEEIFKQKIECTE